MNAAGEVAVHAFLSGRLAFTDISRVIDGAVQSEKREEVRSYEQLSAVDCAARKRAQNIIQEITAK